MVFNLKNILPGAMAVAGAFIATAANAQNVIIPSEATLPNAAITGGVSVIGSTTSLNALPFALPTIGNTIGFQIGNGSTTVVNFTGLTDTGSGVSSAFTIVLDLTLTGPEARQLNFTGSTYSYNANASNPVSPFDAGTAVGISPGGSQNFSYLGGTYQVTVASAANFVAGDGLSAPTAIGFTTLTGTIRNISSPPGVAPEPGTLILAGLGIAGLAARRRRKN